MIQTNVVNTLIKGIDLILRRDWLIANKVVINYEKMNCTIRTHRNSRHAITPLTKGLDNDPEQNQTLAFLNTMTSDRSQTCERV